PDRPTLRFLAFPLDPTDVVPARDETLFLRLPTPQVSDRVRFGVNDMDDGFTQLQTLQVRLRQRQGVQMRTLRQASVAARTQHPVGGRQLLIDRRQWVSGLIAEQEPR